MRCFLVTAVLAVSVFLCSGPRFARAQFNSYGGPSSICLPDLERLNAEREPPAKEPRTIDPGTLLPAPLTKRITLQLVDQWLPDALDQFSTQIDMLVLMDDVALYDSGIPTDPPVNIRLQNEPAYLFLERLTLSPLSLAWFVRDDIVHVTDPDIAHNAKSTRVRPILDLVQAGFSRQELHDTIEQCLGIEWDFTGGIMYPFYMSETLLVTHRSDEANRKIDALLAALRRHSEQTFLLEPAENIRIREKLSETVDVECVDTPLDEFVRGLSEQTGIQIQFDAMALRDSDIPPDEPINLILKDKSVSTVLELAIESPLALEAVPIHGLLLITIEDVAQDMMRTAVFGVGDLCRNECESRELVEMITTQIDASWIEFSGLGGTVMAPRHDVLVIRNTDRALSDVRQLLDDCRRQLAKNPPPETDYTEIETRYYTVSAEQAADLLVTIPELIEPGTWKRVAHPQEPHIDTIAEEGIGSLLRVAARPMTQTLDAPVVRETTDDAAKETEPQAVGRTLVTPQATLIVRHTKLTQLKIARLIQRLSDTNFGSWGGGGGFFHVAPEGRLIEPTVAPSGR